MLCILFYFFQFMSPVFFRLRITVIMIQHHAMFVGMLKSKIQRVRERGREWERGSKVHCPRCKSILMFSSSMITRPILFSFIFRQWRSLFTCVSHISFLYPHWVDTDDLFWSRCSSFYISSYWGQMVQYPTWISNRKSMFNIQYTSENGISSWSSFRNVQKEKKRGREKHEKKTE